MILLCGGLLVSAAAQESLVITSFSDDFADGVVWEGWDMQARSHTLTEADGKLTIAVDKPSDAEKWDGLTMGFGDSTLLDISGNGGYFSVDLKADADCKVDIAVWDTTGRYNPGLNQIDLVAGDEWITLEFEYAGGNLIHFKWNGDTLGIVDASIIDHLLMTFNGGAAWTGNVMMDNMKRGDAAVPPTIITSFEDDFEDGMVWDGWDMQARSHTLTEADGMLTVAVDKPTDAEKWDGLTMGFGDNTLIDIAESGGHFSLDLKADGDCMVDIALWDAKEVYNPGMNKLQLTGGADWVNMMFEYVDGALLRLKWNGDTLGVVDASKVDHLLMTFNGGTAWTGNVMMDNMKIGEAAVPAPMDFMAEKVMFAPVIDGNDNDGEWFARDQKRQVIETLIDGEMDSTFAAQFRAAFDDEKFYVTIQVTDDVLADNENQDQSDYIDLLFDMGNEDNTTNEFGVGWSNYDENDWQIKFRRGQPTWIEVWTDGDGNSMNGLPIDLTQVDFIINDKGATWVLEAAIPWVILMPGFTPADGLEFGFDINVGDADSDARNGRVGWRAMKDTYKSPDLFGTVTMVATHTVVTGLTVDFENGVSDNWMVEPRPAAMSPIYQLDTVEDGGSSALHVVVDKTGGLATPPGDFRWTALRYYMDAATLADMSENPSASLRVKSDTEFNLQLGATPLNLFGNPCGVNMTVAGDGEWHDYEYDFSAIFESQLAEPGTVYMLFVNFNPGASDLKAEVWLDDLKLGDQAVMTGLETASAVPTVFSLSQNYPNPFNPRTTITYALPKASDVSLVIYDINGRVVQKLIDTKVKEGLHKVVWDGKNNAGVKVASGIYFYRLTAGDFVDAKRMLLIK
jgi:hypothetical protein